MKTLVTNTKIIAIALATLFTTSLTVPALANDENDKGKKVAVSYVGNLNDLPVYRLSLQNNISQTYIVSISDSEGNIIHTEKLKGTNIVRNYQFDAEAYNDYTLTFEVNTLNGKTLGVYSVNKTKKVLDEVAVHKIK